MRESRKTHDPCFIDTHFITVKKLNQLHLNMTKELAFAILKKPVCMVSKLGFDHARRT